MPVHLYLAPAAGGKTTYLVERARTLAADPTAANRAAIVRVVAPTILQARAWRRRLAEMGGALGVRVGTFDALYGQILREAGQVYTRLSDPVQYRLLRLLAAQADLVHYQPLRAAPGLIRVMLDLIRELKAGGVFEQDITEAIEHMGNEPRLRELADLYTAYQERLRAEDWADAAGIGWLAEVALQERRDVAHDWPCVMVDGFDDLTSVQLAVLRELAQRDGELLITLTGAPEGPPRREVHKRFNDTRRRIEDALGIQAEPLPAPPDAKPHPHAKARAPTLAHLEATLYAGETSPTTASPSLALIAAPDREGEVRAALRWLKERMVCDEVRPGEAALLARSMDVYRPYVQQVAAEYGLPIHVISGLPLRSNPAVAALIALLRLTVSGGDRSGRPETAYPWRPTVEAWRSPYLDWAAMGPPDGLPDGSAPQDAEALAWVARWGSVIGGLEQWREAFALLEEALAESALAEGQPQALDEEMPPVPNVFSSAEAVRALSARFERFVARITPPAGDLSCRAFVRWIEALIGDEAPVGAEAPRGDAPPADLGIVRAVLYGPRELVERDREALIAFKDILRGLVWAEGALACAPASFGEFLDDLQGAVNTAIYRLPLPADREALLVAGVTQARGVSYRAVAVIGLAEGEFPTALIEDPFLRDADRRRLRDDFDLAVDLTAEGAEAAYFYEAITRSREWLLLTRPRIADNGAPWQESPFWQEVRRQVNVEPLELTSSSQPTPQEVASWPELLRAVGARMIAKGQDGHRDALPTGASSCSNDTVDAASHAAMPRTQSEQLWAWAMAQDAKSFAALQASAAILVHRSTDKLPSPYDGDLTRWGATFGRRYGSHHTWSASRLESYRTCPLFFFVGSVLRLEPRAAPTEGLDARQLGNLYHHILEEIYQAVDDPTDLERLLEVLPQVASPLLEAAPRREGFRATAWWEQTQREMLDNVRDSLRALDELRGEYIPYAYEQAFGITGKPGRALAMADPERQDTFRMRGLIDRVDRAPDGRVRIIDYKTGGPYAFTRKAFAEGKKLQLPLYALAAQEALGLGEVTDGYYWHVRQAGWHLANVKRSAWITLSKMGVNKAMEQALGYAWETLRDVRRGHFAPKTPEDGCPNYCPAAAFCWHYEGQGW